MGHLNGILARVEGNLNNNFQKSQMPGGGMLKLRFDRYITPLPSYLVTLNSYHVTLLPLLTFLPTSYPFRRLLRTLPRARYGVPSDPLSFGWPATQARLG